MKKLFITFMMFLLIVCTGNVYAGEQRGIFTNGCIGPFDGQTLNTDSKQIINKMFRENTDLCPVEEDPMAYHSYMEHIILVRYLSMWIISDTFINVSDATIVKEFNLPLEQAIYLKKYFAHINAQSMMAIEAYNKVMKQNISQERNRLFYRSILPKWRREFRTHPKYKTLLREMMNTFKDNIEKAKIEVAAENEN